MPRLFSRTLPAAVLAVVLAACTPAADEPAPPPEPPPASAAVPPAAVPEGGVGQTVYVPVYSHIYFHDDRRVINLAATLSVRNTDFERPIALVSVRYYDSGGRLVRTYVDAPQALGPLASVDFVIEVDDTSGGSGANFIVEWRADAPVTAPVVEAVMISTASSQGISFVSPGRVVVEYGEE